MPNDTWRCQYCGLPVDGDVVDNIQELFAEHLESAHDIDGNPWEHIEKA